MESPSLLSCSRLTLLHFVSHHVHVHVVLDLLEVAHNQPTTPCSSRYYKRATGTVHAEYLLDHILIMMSGISFN